MNDEKYLNGSDSKEIRHPFDLELELVLGKMPRKVSLTCLMKKGFMVTK